MAGPCRYGCKDPLACSFPHPGCDHCAAARHAAGGRGTSPGVHTGPGWAATRPAKLRPRGVATVLSAIEDRLDSLEANVRDHEQALGRSGMLGGPAVPDGVKWDPDTCYLVDAFAPDGSANGPHDWSAPTEDGSQTCGTCHVVRTPLDRCAAPLGKSPEGTYQPRCLHPRAFHGEDGCRGAIEVGWFTVRPMVYEFDPKRTDPTRTKEARCPCAAYEPAERPETPAAVPPGIPGPYRVQSRVYASHAGAVLARADALWAARRWAAAGIAEDWRARAAVWRSAEAARLGFRGRGGPGGSDDGRAMPYERAQGMPAWGPTPKVPVDKSTR